MRGFGQMSVHVPVPVQLVVPGAKAVGTGCDVLS